MSQMKHKYTELYDRACEWLCENQDSSQTLEEVIAELWAIDKAQLAANRQLGLL